MWVRGYVWTRCSCVYVDPHEMIISSMLPILIAISSADLVKRPPTLGASAKRWSYLGFRVQGLGFRVQG